MARMQGVVRVSKETKERLDAVKLVPEETYESVIGRLLERDKKKE